MAESGVCYLHHRIDCEPHSFRTVSAALEACGPDLAKRGGAVYGIWRSQIGRPRDELTMLSRWEGDDVDGADAILGAVTSVRAVSTDVLRPTLRPLTSTPPARQGNYAFRWFQTPAGHWDEFLSLCEAAWPGFESAYDSQVIGLWRVEEDQALAGHAVRSLLLTRRPDLAMWERSKLPEGADEAEVRRKLNRRYELCDSTVVYTTTLLTASDREDHARWT